MKKIVEYYVLCSDADDQFKEDVQFWIDEVNRHHVAVRVRLSSGIVLGEHIEARLIRDKAIFKIRLNKQGQLLWPHLLAVTHRYTIASLSTVRKTPSELIICVKPDALPFVSPIK